MPVPGETLSKSFEWILVSGAFAAFFFGVATGSNDVANAFGTSVGAKSLSLRTAILLAVVFEFTGAIVLGRVSAETIAGGIAQASTFQKNPVAYAYGMSVVLWVGSAVQLAASYLGLNVSATHCLIGGIVGFAMAYGGAGSVFWAEPDSTKVPPIKGVVPIFLAWIFSPLLTALASAVFYGLSVFFVLKAKNSAQRAMFVLPVLVFATVMIDIYFVFTKGAKKSFSSSDDWTDAKAAWISAIIAAGCAVLSGLIGIPWLRRKLRQKQATRLDGNLVFHKAGSERQSSTPESSDPATDLDNPTKRDALEMMANYDGMAPCFVPVGVTVKPFETGDQGRLSGGSPTPVTPVMAVGGPTAMPNTSFPPSVYSIHGPSHSGYNIHGSPVTQSVRLQVVGSGFGQVDDTVLAVAPQPVDAPEPAGGRFQTLLNFKQKALKSVNYDIHQRIEEDEVVNAIHANATVWDEDTEYVFGFLQVISAICVIFAHGAGEVGYMAGPLAVIYNVVSNPANNIIANNSKVAPEIWVILIGAFGLVFGLAGYGYKVCEAVGTQMAKITPSRGFAAELATSFVIMIAAQLGLPTSSSQCITGGIIGVALFEGSKGLNLKFVATTMASWVVTTVGMAIVCAAIFSNTYYGPNFSQEFSYNTKMDMSYESFCVKTFNYNCKTDKAYYLKDCGFKDGNPNQYFLGTCTSCSDAYTSKGCTSKQWLKGCGVLSSGKCTDCSKTKCADDEILSGCGPLGNGKCVKK